MSSANIGWLFYKDYFRGIDYANLDNPKNKESIQNKVNNIIHQSVTIEDDVKLGNTHFKATTTYPGLILGSGNAHELPSIEGQAILGFHFDYTSGLPVIQGSSIKGVLRSAFAYPKYITGYVGEGVDIKALEKEIFDNGDVFFDATIISNGKILGDDFITPHGDNPLKNPTPLRFIKVLPNVEFRFDFELRDGILSRSEKESLFRKILSDLGLGAKTNVGYGKFSDFTAIAKTKEEIAQEEALKAKQEEERLNKLSPIDRVFDKYENNIPNIINAMKAKKIEERLLKELAEKIKAELIKKPKEWEKAKQKALKRKEYIESILEG
jgi:CRISPR-associated protein Cmr6